MKCFVHLCHQHRVSRPTKKIVCSLLLLIIICPFLISCQPSPTKQDNVEILIFPHETYFSLSIQCQASILSPSAAVFTTELSLAEMEELLWEQEAVTNVERWTHSEYKEFFVISLSFDGECLTYCQLIYHGVEDNRFRYSLMDMAVDYIPDSTDLDTQYKILFPSHLTFFDSDYPLGYFGNEAIPTIFSDDETSAAIEAVKQFYEKSEYQSVKITSSNQLECTTDTNLLLQINISSNDGRIYVSTSILY